jgi:hypothetical protein
MAASLCALDLISEAERTTGLSDWGEDDFRTPLTVLVDALNTQAELSGIGIRRVRQWLGKRLEQRLRVLADRARRPQIAAQQIDRPVFIIGLPRSGTTFLHTLISRDPAAIVPLHWQLVHASPPPNDPAIEHEAEIAATQALLGFQGWLDPDLQTMHFSDALLPEEDFIAFELSFISMSLYAFFDIPAYASGVLKSDFAASYAWHKRVLQAIQFGAEGKRFVLKAPEHTMHLDMLLETYPDALVIQHHRDPAKVMASTLSLLSTVRKRYTDRAIPASEDVAQRYIRSYARSFRRCIELRDDPRFADRFLDVHYLDLERDPVSVVRRVYDHAGMAFTPGLEADVRGWAAVNRKGSKGAHIYPDDGYGLTPESVHAAFADYIRRFDVEIETGGER